MNQNTELENQVRRLTETLNLKNNQITDQKNIIDGFQREINTQKIELGRVNQQLKDIRNGKCPCCGYNLTR
jgi:hypothetical protein